MTALRVGQIGLGATGSRIAIRLLRSGFSSLQIYDVDDITTRMLNNEQGGIITGSPRMMARACDIIITMLPSSAILREVVFGWEGLARGLAKGGVIVDMGGGEADATVALARELAALEIALIDAPALGTPAAAREGNLTLVVGGDDAAVERCRPILDVLGKRTLRAGAAGSGHAAAALAEYLAAVELLAASEMLRIARRFGLEPAAMLGIAEALGSIGPAARGALREHVMTDRFASGSALGLARKHLDAAFDAARAVGVESPLLASCRDAWAAAEASLGWGADRSSVIRWLELLVPPTPAADSTAADTAC